jgi:hypothetical protein
MVLRKSLQKCLELGESSACCIAIKIVAVSAILIGIGRDVIDFPLC